ncbi:hypothetical protein JW756_05745 [Candidatus Woesearchaeota archaeon]|nr:hypothetical protein [Candidatus Woesearchaeota archaeon]
MKRIEQEGKDYRLNVGEENYCRRVQKKICSANTVAQAMRIINDLEIRVGFVEDHEELQRKIYHPIKSLEDGIVLKQTKRLATCSSGWYQTAQYLIASLDQRGRIFITEEMNTGRSDPY